MNQLKFSLGPFEIFSSIVGGIPLLMAGCLIYSPFKRLPDLLPLMREEFVFAGCDRAACS